MALIVVLEIIKYVHDIGAMCIKLHEAGVDVKVMNELKDIVSEVRDTIREQHDNEVGE